MDLLQYVRRRRGGKNVRAGVMLAKLVNDKVVIGWSKCKLKSDKFDAKLGVELAAGRVSVANSALHPIPHSIKKDIDEFQERCKRYFKNANGVVVV